MQTVLTVSNLNKSFPGVQALKNINLQIKSEQIHCLVGENGCGKSTLIKCIAGVHAPDAGSGSIVLNGNAYSMLTPRKAMHEGVQVIYQDLSLFQHMSIAENIAIGKFRAKAQKMISRKAMHQLAETQLDQIGVHIDLNQTIAETSVANRQLTAIARALAQEAKILFMDEPTTALTKREVSRLLEVMLELKKKGLAIVFISHKLDEIFSVADEITIFRNGDKIGDFKTEELDQNKITYYMTGKEVKYKRYVRTHPDPEPLLELEHLTRKNHFSDISLKVRKGDIIGLTGLLGAGRTELAMSLFGLNPSDSGTIKMEGKTVRVDSPIDAKERGISLLSEDRANQGLFLDRKIKENISSAVIDEISVKNRLNLKKEEELAQKYIEQLNIRTPSINKIVAKLSGGNQQKVVIGKWLAANPKVFIMDTPTVGIDIGSKAEIYDQIHKFADQGMAIIFISDEVPELLANCNKIIIMARGEFVKILEDELNQPQAEQVIAEMVSKSDQVKKESEQVEAKIR